MPKVGFREHTSSSRKQKEYLYESQRLKVCFDSIKKDRVSNHGFMNIF